MFQEVKNAVALSKRATRAIFPMACFTLMICTMPQAHAQSASLIGGAGVARMEQARKDAAAEERQKKMLNDAQRLVEMAQALKVSVDKTNKDTLSIEVIREAERIEKLAREVREGMRQ